MSTSIHSFSSLVTLLDVVPQDYLQRLITLGESIPSSVGAWTFTKKQVCWLILQPFRTNQLYITYNNRSNLLHT